MRREETEQEFRERSRKEAEQVKFIVKIMKFVVPVLIVFAIWSTHADLDKIPHRDEGIFAVETLTAEGEVKGIGERIVFANGRRRHHQHNISVYLEVIDDFVGDRLSEEELAKYQVGDTVVITREVYYLKPGFRFFTVDHVGEIVG